MDAEIELLRPYRSTSDQVCDQEYVPDSIFVIHGFHGPKYISYRHTLEQWVLREARKLTNPVEVYALRFNASAIPSRGKALLGDAVWKLRMFLLKLLPADSDSMSVNTQNSGQDNNSSNQESRSSTGKLPPSERRINFVAHGLGSWIVKDVLAHPTMDSITYTYRRIDIKFLDVSISNRTDSAYRTYLERNWSTFGIRSRKLKTALMLDQLVPYLQEIDENYDKFANSHNKAIVYYSVNKGSPRPSKIYQDLTHPLWMSDENSIERDQREQGWDLQPVSRLITGEHVPVTSARTIGELPSSLEAALLLAPRPHENEHMLQVLAHPHISISKTSPLSPTSEVQSPTSPPLEGRLRVLGQATVTRTEHPASSYFPSAQCQAPTRAHHPSKNHDTVTVVSTPDFTTMSSRHLRSACILANTFLQIGDLENADIMFEKVLAHTKPDPKDADRMWILMQLAAVKIYRGCYNLAMKELQFVEGCLETTSATIKDHKNLLYHCQRWMATCQLYCGRWQQAASQMQKLLDSDPKRLHLRLYRDQALAYAYLGQYEKARSCLELAKERARSIKDGVPRQAKTTMATQGSKSSSESHKSQAIVVTRQEKEHKVKENSLKAAQACIDLLAGGYLTALKDSSEALRYMKATVGSKHFRTMATAILQSWSLGYNDRYDEAEKLCLTTYKATKAALGRNHPQTLEAIGCLIYLYRCQGRFAEAVGTGMSATSVSLHGNGNDDMRDHPQHMSVEFQLAQSFMEYGDYVDSRVTFSRLVPRAEYTMGETHPETLRYTAGQAQILLRLGCIQEARDIAARIAVQQFQLYHRNLISNSSIIEDSCKLILERAKPHVTRLSELANLLDRVLTCPALSKVLHPFLLSTLQVTAEIEIRQFQLTSDNEAELSAAQRILESLQRAHHDTNSIEEGKNAKKSLALASIAMDLATLFRVTGGHLSQAVEHYTYAYKTRKELLDEDYLSTLIAQRDLTIAQTMLSTSTSGSIAFLQQTKKLSGLLCRKFWSRLGPRDYETLITRLWCLTVDFMLSQFMSVVLNEAARTDEVREPTVEDSDKSVDFLLVQYGQDKPVRVEEATRTGGATEETLEDLSRADHGLESSSSSSSSGSTTPRDGENGEDNKDINDSKWREIHECLTDPTVLEQRLVESLAMRSQLAGLLRGVGMKKQALVVVDRAIDDIKQALATMTSANIDESGDNRITAGEEGRVKEPREGEGEEGLKETLRKLNQSFEKLKGDCTGEPQVG